MIIRRNEMKSETKEKLRDGKGAASFTYLVDCEKEKNVRLLAELTLLPGSSIGYHRHDSEAEYFFILSGSGTVNDNGTESPVKAGDAVVTGSGFSHSITNTGDVPLVMHAIIVTH